jgi:hypothetical protein
VTTVGRELARRASSSSSGSLFDVHRGICHHISTRGTATVYRSKTQELEGGKGGGDCVCGGGGLCGAHIGVWGGGGDRVRGAGCRVVIGGEGRWLWGGEPIHACEGKHARPRSWMEVRGGGLGVR